MYGPELCKFWYRLYYGDHDYDLYPESMGDGPTHCKMVDGEWESLEPPTWWPWWLSDFDIGTALGISFGDGHVKEFGRTWHQPWRAWALANGVAPGQLFCVEVGAPEVVKSGWEVVEYDEEWDASLLEIAPMSKRGVANRWEDDLRKTARDRALHVREADKNAALIDRDFGSMYIQQHMYCPNSSEDWRVPSGRSLVLQSTRHLYPCAATSMGVSGSDDRGNLNNAMENFITNACKANPYLSPDVIRTLELRR